MCNGLHYNRGMKGGDSVKYLIDKAWLDRQMKRAGFNSYYEIVESAKHRGIEIVVRTIYNMADGGNYSQKSLAALCAALRCTPADLIPAWNGDANTHAAPQPAQEPETAIL